MPYLRIETNVPQDKIPSDLPAKLCKVLSKSLGKPENYCVASVIGGINMSFGGTNEPAAQGQLLSIGGIGLKENKKHSEALYPVINQAIGVAPNKMYIHYQNVASSDMGFQGTTFHDILG